MASARRFFPTFFLLLVFSTAHSWTEGQSDPVKRSNKGFELFTENGKVGMKDQDGKVVIPAQHEALGWSNGTFSMVERVTGYQRNGMWGLIDHENNKVTEADYVDLSPGDATTIVARKKIPGSVRVVAGCINAAGKEVVPFQYDGLRIASFRAIVYNRTGVQFKHGLIDLGNKLLIPLQFQNIYPLGSLRFAVENFEHKTAIYSEDGTRVTEFVIDSLSSFKKDFSILYEGRKQGLINRRGQIVLQPAACEIKIHNDGSIGIRKHDAWYFLSGENRLLRECHADSVEALTEGLFKAKTGNVFQLLNKDLQVVDAALYSSIGPLQSGRAIVAHDGKKGMIDETGKPVLPLTFNHLIRDDGVIRANIRIGDRNRWVLVDHNGKTIGSKSYDYIGPFNGSFSTAMARGYWGAIDRSGNEIIACVHDSLIEHRDNRLVVKFRGSYGIMDLNEQWVVGPQKYRIKIVDTDHHLLYSGHTSFLKRNNSETIYFSQNRLEPDRNGLIEYLPSGEVWKISLTGQIVDRFYVAPGVDRVFEEHEGLRIIRRDGRYGFVDNQGRLRIANRYEDAEDFSENMAAVKIRGRWGFVNREDALVVQPVYDDVFPFHNGIAIVRQEQLHGAVDKTGQVILPVRFEEIADVDGKRFKVRQNGLWGLCDRRGVFIIHPKYETLEDLDNGYVIVSRDGKFGLITVQGVSTIPQLYDGLVYDRIHNTFIAHKKSAWETLQL